MTPVLVDAGFLIALYDKREPMHQRCLQSYDSIKNPLVTCEAVVGEALHLLRRLPLAVRDLLASVDQGILEIPFSLPECAASVAALMEFGMFSALPCEPAINLHPEFFCLDNSALLNIGVRNQPLVYRACAP